MSRETGHRARVLVLGYGNPGRLDDGLGPALAEAVAALGIEGVDADAGYQLQPEDALRVAAADAVVFADAAADGPEPFSFRRIGPRAGSSFTTHELSPETLLALAGETLGALPEAWLMEVRGYAFDAFGEALSPRARQNLAAALAFLEPALRTGPFREVGAGSDLERGG